MLDVWPQHRIIEVSQALGAGKLGKKDFGLLLGLDNYEGFRTYALPRLTKTKISSSLNA